MPSLPEPGEEGAELQHYVERKAARIYSGAMYRRLKATVDGWRHEERAKARVAVQSILWFVFVMSAAFVLGRLTGIGALGYLAIGFMVWLAVVLAVMAEQLARKPGEAAKPRRLADRALLGLAIAADALGILTTWPLFAMQPTPASVGRGILLLALFGALLALLMRPRWFGARLMPAAGALCAAVPLAALIGALDLGAVSGLEAYAIVVSALIGWLNWFVIRRQAAQAAP